VKKNAVCPRSINPNLKTLTDAQGVAGGGAAPKNVFYWNEMEVKKF
jgi:hypothetical protein